MSRPVCTCGPETNHCPAEEWWEQEGRYQVAAALHIRSANRADGLPGTPHYQDRGSPHPTRFAPTGGRRQGSPTGQRKGGRQAVTRELFERDVRAWIAKKGRLPTISDFDADSGLHHSSRWVYRFYGSLPGFWKHAVEHGWAPEAMRLERIRKMQERPKRLKQAQYVQAERRA